MDQVLYQNPKSSLGYPCFGTSRIIWATPVVMIAIVHILFSLKIEITENSSLFSESRIVSHTFFFDYLTLDILSTVIQKQAIYFCRFFRIGTIILALHDTSDVFMESAKLFKYSGMEMAASFFFGLFAVSWFLLRLIYFPFWIIKSSRLSAAPCLLLFSFHNLCLFVLIIVMVPFSATRFSNSCHGWTNSLPLCITYSIQCLLPYSSSTPTGGN